MGDASTQPTRPVLPNEMEKSLSIREYEQRHDALKSTLAGQFSHLREVSEIRAAALEKALDLQAAAQEKALLLQASEYARRLEELNHAHKIATENWARSLPRENFDLVVNDLNRWRDQTNQTIQTALGALGLIRWMGLLGVIALILSFLRMAKVIP